MTRRAHWLRAQPSAHYPHDLVVFDTETVEDSHYTSLSLDGDWGVSGLSWDTIAQPSYTVEHRLVFGWAARIEYTSRGTWTDPDWFRFTSYLEFWQWLESRCRDKRALWVYCHNANFDWQVCRMTTALPSLDWVADSAIIEDPPNYFTWHKGTKTLKLLDSTNYWQAPLRDLGKRLGLEKYELPSDWNNQELSDTYCRRDVEILLVSLVKWIAWLQEHQLGGLGISLAQQAWKAYIHRFLDAPIYIDTNEDALELARDSYYGGRVECLTLNTHCADVHCLDINSMYPYVMDAFQYPTRLHGIYRKVSHAELAKWCAKYCVVARVIIQTDIPIYPERTVDSLVFPIGTFQTALCTPELMTALGHGHIVEIQEAAIYDKASIFSRFVRELYALRLEAESKGDEVAKYYIKILLNSLYGKFGQRGLHEEIIGTCDPSELYVETEIDLETGKRYRNRHIAGLILSRSSTGESRYSHPAIAAHVTAYARNYLWTLLQVAGIENVHYMDTDSLHVNELGHARLATYINPTKLGALKVEKLIRTAIYYGPKDYELDGVRRIKGISKSAEQNDVTTFSQSQWVSLKGACLADHTGGPLVRRVTKTYSRRYRKGTPLATGRVLPLRRILAHIRGMIDAD